MCYINNACINTKITKTPSKWRNSIFQRHFVALYWNGTVQVAVTFKIQQVVAVPLQGISRGSIPTIVTTMCNKWSE